jgi:predicted P-loop ATPase
LSDFAGAPDTPYARAVASKTLIAAVRRVRDPGCKHDEMLVLEGVQGAGKSTLFETLCPDSNWFTDAVTLSMDTKEIMEVTQGKWIVEAPELSKLSGAEVEHVKALLSRRTDTARMAYGKHAQDRPRQFIFTGSTNARQYLLDQTGNRRFWPLETGEINPSALRDVLGQLWGEAAHREALGESNALPQDLWSVAGQEQAARMYDNPYAATLSARIGNKTGSITMSHVQDIFDLKARERRASVRDLTAAMESLGWTYSRRDAAFVKGNPERRLTVLSGAVMEPATRLTVT